MLKDLLLRVSYLDEIVLTILSLKKNAFDCFYCQGYCGQDLFTEWAPTLFQSINCDVRLLFVCPLLEIPLPGGLQISGQRACW